jgi:hypothetical protein
MNSVMAQAERKARPDNPPEWRLFQLAFILLNLPSVEDEAHTDRELVESSPMGPMSTPAAMYASSKGCRSRRARYASAVAATMQSPMS